MSPIRAPRPAPASTHVASVLHPTLILVGANEARTPPANSGRPCAGLMTRGVPAGLVRCPREGHGAREHRHRRDRCTRTRAWFERWVK